MKNRTQVGRLAMRVEGDLWSAYYAMPDTMDGAILLGSIRMGIVTTSPDRKQTFMDLMKDAVSEILTGAAGSIPEWEVKTAPEHERSGSA